MAYNKNTAILYTLVFCFYLLLNGSGTSVPKQNVTKPYRRIIYSLLTTTSKPGRVTQPVRKFWWQRTTTRRTTTTRPFAIWVDSYYIEDKDYPLFRAKPPLPEARVERGVAILTAQVIPLFKSMLNGPKDLSRKRGFVPRWVEYLFK